MGLSVGGDLEWEWLTFGAGFRMGDIGRIRRILGFCVGQMKGRRGVRLRTLSVDGDEGWRCV